MLEFKNTSERPREGQDIQRDITEVRSDVEALLMEVREEKGGHTGESFMRRLAAQAEKLRMLAEQLDDAKAIFEDKQSMRREIQASYRYIGEGLGYINQIYPIEKSDQ